jgi:membrane-bound serine protease (ClpP class)
MNLIALLLSAFVAAASPPPQKCVIEASLNNTIGLASLDFVQRAKKRAAAHDCGSVLMLINTPGGSLQTTRLIVEEILNSPVPFLCFVYPAGAHAGSAGAIILESCHLAGAVSASNIGAATPISETGENIPTDLRNKILNDTVAWLDSIVKVRGRSSTFAKDIIEKAKAVSAKEAYALKAIDFVGDSKAEFMQFAAGRSVKLVSKIDGASQATVTVGPVVPFEQDLRFRVMDLLMNPQFAYLLLMGSLALLYFELTHPGMVAPGVVGGIGFILALISLHTLDATWGSVLLILVGIALLFAEAFVAGYGVIGFGGVVSFFVGSLFLFDPELTGYSLPLSLILPTVVLIGALMLGIAYMAFSARRRQRKAGYDGLVGRSARITEVQAADGHLGFLEVSGELWKCRSEDLISLGDEVKIVGHDGLTLKVDVISKSKGD